MIMFNTHKEVEQSKEDHSEMGELSQYRHEKGRGGRKVDRKGQEHGAMEKTNKSCVYLVPRTLPKY